jgi:hypothetical protein
LLASAIAGGFIGSTFDTVYGDGDGTIAGAFAGLLAFTCARLWLESQGREARAQSIRPDRRQGLLGRQR